MKNPVKFNDNFIIKEINLHEGILENVAFRWWWMIGL